MRKFATKLGIRKDEHNITVLSIGYASLIGFVQVLIKTIPIILFLSHYKPAILPYAYIISSLILILMGAGYTLLARRISVNTLLLSLAVMVGGLFVLFWASDFLSDKRGVYFALLIWAQASFAILDWQMWAILNRLFTLEQSKRLFGIIGMCQSMSAVIGSLAIPLFVLTLGANNSILVIGLIAFTITIFLRIIIKLYAQHFSQPEAVDVSAQPTESSVNIKFNWRDSYLINNMLFVATSLAIYVIIDFMFYTEGSRLFQNEMAFAVFLGIFFAVLNVFDLINRAFVSKFLIRKLGIRAGLLIKSVSVGAVALLLVAAFPMNREQHVVFILCVIMKMFDEGFSNSIVRQSLLTLYQPLPANLRSSLQKKIEGFIIPSAIILVSIILLIFQYFSGFRPVYLGMLILFIIILTIIITSFLQKGYVLKLRDTLIKRRVPRQSHVDKNYANLVLDKIKTGTERETIYCLGLMKDIDPKHFSSSLVLCLKRSEENVVYTALYYLNTFSNPLLLKEIEIIALTHPKPTIKSLAFRAMIFQYPKNKKDSFILSFINEKDDWLADEALIAALNHTKNQEIIDIASKELANLIRSTNPKKRIRAATILRQVTPQKKLLPQLNTLLNDADANVKNSAILAVSEFQDKTLFELLINLLDDNLFRQASLSSLIKAGNNAIAALTDSLNVALLFKNDSKIAQIIKIIGFIKGPAARRRLLQILRKTEGRDIHLDILQSLRNRKYKAKVKTEIATINKFINSEASRLLFFLTLREKIGDSTEFTLLASIFDKQIRTIKNNIFALLEFIYPSTTLQKINFYLDSPDTDKSSYAKQLLEHTVSGPHKQLVALIWRIYSKEDDIHPSHEELGELLKELLSYPTLQVTSMIKSAAIYLSTILRIDEITDSIPASLNDRDPLVHETAKWALSIPKP
ncbi:MAG: HEAT repeat domain-containing protein [Gammaproteobacteria bacterium]|nr:HEAT repeat domain-containing protein [Gammaproteobacteria bacterium]